MGCWGLFVLGVGFLVVFFFGGVGVCWVFGGGFWLGFGLVWGFFFERARVGKEVFSSSAFLI